MKMKMIMIVAAFALSVAVLSSCETMLDLVYTAGSIKVKNTEKERQKLIEDADRKERNAQARREAEAQ